MNIYNISLLLLFSQCNVSFIMLTTNISDEFFKCLLNNTVISNEIADINNKEKNTNNNNNNNNDTDTNTNDNNHNN